MAVVAKQRGQVASANTCPLAALSEEPGLCERAPERFSGVDVYIAKPESASDSPLPGSEGLRAPLSSHPFNTPAAATHGEINVVPACNLHAHEADATSWRVPQVNLCPLSTAATGLFGLDLFVVRPPLTRHLIPYFARCFYLLLPADNSNSILATQEELRLYVNRWCQK